MLDDTPSDTLNQDDGTWVFACHEDQPEFGRFMDSTGFAN